jgi:hypothetical protein
MNRTSRSSDSMSVSVCANCQKTVPLADLAPISHGFWERVSPGEIMPSGECPGCGALCHPLENALSPFIGVLKRLIETVAATGGLVKYPDGRIAPAASPQWFDLGDAVLLGNLVLAGHGVRVRLLTKQA